MKGLVLDTSTERGIVAVVDHGAIVFQEQLPFGLQNSHFLLPALYRRLKDHGLKLHELSFVGVGVGPGSYTGIRVGAMIAKTLSFTCGLPLIGVCTLDLFVDEGDGEFAAVIDAKIGGVYLQKGGRKNGIVQSTGPMLSPLDEAKELLADVPTIITPNAEKIRSKLEVRGVWLEKYPSAERLAQLARQKMQKGGHAKPLELLYMRETWKH